MSRLKPFPEFPFDPAKFTMETAALTCEQRGAFIALLCHQWHGFGIPDSVPMIMRLTGCREHSLHPVLEFFPQCPDGMRRNKGLEDIRTHKDAVREARRKVGAEGGRPKKPSKERKRKIPEEERAKRLPTTEASILIAKTYHRRLDTPWSEDEIKAFKKNMPYDMEDLKLACEYTAREMREKGFHRRDIKTFCNNYLGEVDKARGKKIPARNGAKEV